jgi:hypothetical protein
VEVAPIENTGVVTVGVMVIVLATWAEGPLQPFAVTLISTVPENPFAQVIRPVKGLILPAAGLLTDQLKFELHKAEVAKDVVVVALINWQVGGVPDMEPGVLTVGVTNTVFETCAEGPLQPLAVTLISTEPEKPFAHVITPVTEFMVPADALLTDQLKPVLFEAVVV